MKLFFPNSAAVKGTEPFDRLQLKKKNKIMLAGFCAHPDPAFGHCLMRQAEAWVEGTVYEIEQEKMWELDQIFSPAIFYRKEIEEKAGIFGIFFNSEEQTFSSVDFLCVQKKQQRSLTKCDLLLMIPGYCDPETKTLGTSHFIGNHLNDSIGKMAEAEFAGQYVKDNTRITLGNVMLALCPCHSLERSCSVDRCTIQDEILYQPAVVNLLIHNETLLCVAEIYIPVLNIAIEAVLEQYCRNALKIKIGDRLFSMQQYLESFGVQACGGKRSMVFVQEQITEEKLLQILVNEDTTMGKITGKHFCEMIKNDLAQYDAAKVYASETTMVEIIKDPLPDVSARIDWQAIEIFFVEMLLLHDAAVSKMNQTVKAKVEEEQKKPYGRSNKTVVDGLALEMSKVTDFADYKQFYYPTVRVSAEKLAEAFGLRAITDKFEQNKALLQQIMDSHSKKINKKENQIKNSLLFVISIFSGIGVIDAFLQRLMGQPIEPFSFWVAGAMMLLGIAVYFMLKTVVRFSLNKKHEKSQKKRKNG